MNYEKVHTEYRLHSIEGRYVNLGLLESFLNLLNAKVKVDISGFSVQGRPIYKCQMGRGETKILMWSQMHGNESTTTKGLIDFINSLQSGSDWANQILSEYTFVVFPMLNPDGAEVYTRVNANEIDLNRDFQELTQPESKLLMDCHNAFKPDYCYNLHDQRTVFGVGLTGMPATMSFLAPSYNEEKEYNDSRIKAVFAIMKMVKSLQHFIPGQISRFDDSFNSNCVGDQFQSLGTPTVLIEAGHYPNDYEREETRKYVFIALLSVFYSSSENVVVDCVLSDYLNIPQNIPNYYDIVYKNVRVNYDNSDLITNFALQFREQLVNNKVVFNAFIAKVGNFHDFFGHIEYDAKEALYSDSRCNFPKLDEKADFSLNNRLKFVNGLVKN